VLEQVGEAGSPRALVFRADFLTDRDGEYGSVMIFGDDHAQAVTQARVTEFDRRDFSLGGRRITPESGQEEWNKAAGQLSH